MEKKSRIWLDLCAAPGGKTGILARHLGTSDILVANEVVGQRRSILKENLVKSGFVNTFITGEPSSSFNQPFADIILIDVPCAGEGMMRKEPEAIRQWTPALVDSCSVMQKQIVMDAAQALKKDGYLIYSTCSYSLEENIHNIAHFISKHNLEPVSLSFPVEWGIAPIEEGVAKGYQLYPHKVKGEGLFIAVLRRINEQEKHSFKKIRKPTISFEPAPTLVAGKLNDASMYLLRKSSASFEIITAEAREKADEVLMYLQGASLVVDAGELKGKDFIPSHVMAMSGIQSRDYGIIKLDLTHALDYLERNTYSLPPLTSPGWYMIEYDTTILGWVKGTQQGWKNHYPMNWRLRDRNKVRS
jgi:NOL1/NOP2/fmu family ribosome biogenesis protein